ncbi:MAG: CHAT domain-containing protein [Calothrix sp. C42_A2020_038]|nr:CHAT domain-containing protein [Calothrix sp. C42_A2020_038]
MRFYPPSSRLKSLSLSLLIVSLVPTITLSQTLTLPQAAAQILNSNKNQADKLLQEGERLQEQNQLPAALKTFERALQIYRQVKNRQGEGESINRIGNIYADLNQVQQAFNYYQQGLQIAQATNNTGLEAKILSNIGLTYLGMGDSTRATEYCTKALTIARTSNNRESEALALKALGAITISSDASQGVNYIEQALAAIRQAQGAPNDRLRQRKLETSILMSLGGFHYGIGVSAGLSQTTVLPGKTPKEVLDKSLTYYQEAAIIAKETGDSLQQAKALSGVGSVHNIRSEFTQAVKLYEQALAIFKQNNAQIQIRDTLSSLGEAYVNWNNKDKALLYYQEALTVSQTLATNLPVETLDKNTQQGLIEVNIANAYADTSKYEQAIKFYKQAIQTLKASLNQAENIKSPNPNDQFLINGNKQLANQGIKISYLRMCSSYQILGQYDASKKACQDASAKLPTPTPPKKTSKELEEAQQSLAKAQSLGNRNLEAFALAQIGQAYANLSEKKVAWEYFQKAIELARTYPLFEYYALFQAGFFQEQQQKYDIAINYYQKAAVSASKNNQKLEEANIFRQIGTLNYNRNRLPEATTALYNAIKVYESIRVDLSDKSQISIFETQAQVYSLLQTALIAQNKIEEALEVSERGRARAFINLLATRQSQKSNFVNILPPTLKDIQKIAQQQNATFVQYSIANQSTKNEIYIWVIKPTGEIAFEKVDLKPLNTSLQNLVATTLDSIGATRGISVEVPDEIKSPSNQSQKLQQLHQLLIAPISQHLPQHPHQRVIFFPQNELFFIPFPALQDQTGKYLVKKHIILTAPSIQVLQLTQRRASTSKNVLVVGNPTMPNIQLKPGQAPQQLANLPYAEAEAREIAAMLNTKPLIGKEATKNQVKQLMSKARIIHLATHGLLDDFDLGIPGAIVLAPTSISPTTSQTIEGLLTASEIFEMKLDADLVVLSACQTGQGKLTGDGVIGLSRSLIAAGTKSVIVSLWNVDDASTQLLMTEFYRQLQQNPDKGAALRHAMLTTMQKYPNPEKWSAFTLIGESI